MDDQQLERHIDKFFWDADKDRSGSLSLAELRTSLAKNGYVMTETQFKDKFSAFDEDQDGSIWFHEYLKGMGRHPEQVRKYAEIARVFQLFDKSGNGYVSRDEITAMFKGRGRTLTRRQLDNIMKHVDVDRSGRIEMDEFIALYTNMK